jgi:hypothetical protein
MVTKEWAEYVFCLCDECVAVYGRPPGAVELPESLVVGHLGLSMEPVRLDVPDINADSDSDSDTNQGRE